jgi:hypothetical protein
MEEPGAGCELNRYAARYSEGGRNAKAKKERIVVAIRSENAKRFVVPLRHLEALRNEFTAVPEPTRL